MIDIDPFDKETRPSVCFTVDRDVPIVLLMTSHFFESRFYPLTPQREVGVE